MASRARKVKDVERVIRDGDQLGGDLRLLPSPTSTGRCRNIVNSGVTAFQTFARPERNPVSSSAASACRPVEASNRAMWAFKGTSPWSRIPRADPSEAGLFIASKVEHAGKLPLRHSVLAVALRLR